mgnify:CR=1 FL=1
MFPPDMASAFNSLWIQGKYRYHHRSGTDIFSLCKKEITAFLLQVTISEFLDQDCNVDF